VHCVDWVLNPSSRFRALSTILQKKGRIEVKMGSLTYLKRYVLEVVSTTIGAGAPILVRVDTILIGGKDIRRLGEDSWHLIRKACACSFIGTSLLGREFLDSWSSPSTGNKLSAEGGCDI